MYGSGVPTSINAGLAVVPVTGAALGWLWLVLLGLTLIVLAFAVKRLVPAKEY